MNKDEEEYDQVEGLMEEDLEAHPIPCESCEEEGRCGECKRTNE